MIARYDHLRGFPSVFLSMTGLRLAEFDIYVAELLPAFAAQQQTLHIRPDRQRAPGAGHPFQLDPRDQILLTIIWLRLYPTREVLGFFFGVSDTTAGRIISRVLPLLEEAGRTTMRMPDPGKKKRRSFDALLADLPELFVVIDSFEQRVQRSADRGAADNYYSGKKKMHTLKSQVAVDGQTGEICDVSESVAGPTADIKLVEQSGVLERLPEGVGAEGDLAYIGIDKLYPQGQVATPRKKPRGTERPAEDVVYNRAFASRRIIVEHTIGRLRRYETLSGMDREHRVGHAARVRAVSGLVNHQLRSRYRAVAA